MATPAEYSTVEAAPYEAPVNTLPQSIPHIHTHGSQPPTAPVLYEEPLRSVAEYEVAVSMGTVSPQNMYSSVDEATREIHEYTSLHPPNIDREQHLYTPPLPRATSLSSIEQDYQDHTYFVLDKHETDRQTQSLRSQQDKFPADETEAEYTYITQETDHKQSKDHMYLTLDKTHTNYNVQ